jgi:hypothetical protein
MSSIKNAVRVPTLPIEIWFETGASYVWDVCGDDVRILRVKERKTRRFEGKNYLNALIEVATPEELGRFVEEFGCPIGKYGWFNFPLTILWDDFLEIQDRLRKAMVLQISKVLSRDEVKAIVNPDTFDIKVERREEVYYGTLTKDAVWESCYTVIIFERLLADTKYSICKECPNTFQITSGHRRKYCSERCAHNAAQQAFRERENEKSKNKKSKRLTPR